MNKPIRKVVIAGGGTAGWMAAATIGKVLGKVLDITLVESDAISTVGVGEATVPHIRFFNSKLGFDEADFMARTKATFKLGIEFRDWSRKGDAYIHPFGAFGSEMGGVPFHQQWVRARRSGSSSGGWGCGRPWCSRPRGAPGVPPGSTASNHGGVAQRGHLHRLP